MLKLSNIDFTTSGAVKIGTTAVGKRFVPTRVISHADAISGTLTIPPIVNVGSNASNYNNISTAQTLTPLAASNNFGLVTIAGTVSIAGGVDIFVNITTPASGAGLVMTGTIIVEGYLV